MKLDWTRAAADWSFRFNMRVLVAGHEEYIDGSRC